MSNIFFTADLHFGHKRILEFSSKTRPCLSVEEHDELIIRNWNNQVSHNDTVYVLGDVSWSKHDRTVQLLSCLSGHKNLILGNHDNNLTGESFRKIFEDIRVYREVKIDGIDVIMMHYPILEWNKAHHGSMMLHGHVHGKKIKSQGRCMDVGIDTRGGKMDLWPWDEVKEILIEREIITHHES